MGRASYTLKDMQNLARSRGGKCLSKKYVNSHSKLDWQCSKMHTWEARPYIVIGAKNKKGTWCPYCSGNIGTTVQTLQKLAKSRGGKFLSKTYTKSHSVHRWQCANGHTFTSTPSSVKTGKWCPECSSFMGERFCRILFESIFKVKFKKSYPRWLTTKEGNQLELDGYNPKLKLAFEHHGNQHYKFIKMYHKNLETFQQQQDRDKQKRFLCESHGITLIEIPEVQAGLALKDLKGFVMAELEKSKLILTDSQRNLEVDYSKVYIKTKHEEYLNNLKKIVVLKKGKLLTKGYLGSKVPHEFKCVSKHTFQMIPNGVLSGQWCPQCGGSIKGTIEDVIAIVEAKGGKCLDSKYINNHTPIAIECSKGHTWKAALSHLKNGHWCPYCAKNKKILLVDLQN